MSKEPAMAVEGGVVPVGKSEAPGGAAEEEYGACVDGGSPGDSRTVGSRGWDEGSVPARGCVEWPQAPTESRGGCVEPPSTPRAVIEAAVLGREAPEEALGNPPAVYSLKEDRVAGHCVSPSGSGIKDGGIVWMRGAVPAVTAASAPHVERARSKSSSVDAPANSLSSIRGGSSSLKSEAVTDCASAGRAETGRSYGMYRCCEETALANVSRGDGEGCVGM